MHAESSLRSLGQDYSGKYRQSAVALSEKKQLVPENKPLSARHSISVVGLCLAGVLPRWCIMFAYFWFIEVSIEPATCKLGVHQTRSRIILPC
jgi:hypothetical protein